jgi:acyl-CoA synthetase (AMP-forming)/AMP-acid ligase II
MSNRLEFVESDFGIAKAGLVKAPINIRLSDEERRFILGNCTAEAVITERTEVERLVALRGDLPHLRYVISVDGGGTSYHELLQGASSAPVAVQVEDHRPSMILHTSGTTGRPKGAVTSESSRTAAMLQMLLDEFLPNEDDGMIHAAPMSHGSGSKILAFFVRGARNITLAKFEPAAFFDALRVSGGTSSFLVPTMVRMLLDYADTDIVESRRRIRNITYGGAPMPPALAEEALAAFGPVLTQVYGSCEAPHPVTVLTHHEHLTGGGALLSSVGHETFGVTVRIADPQGEEVSDGETGELWVKGANVMSGYWGDETATREVFADGWYRSGDLARRSGDGVVYIQGRKREMLISGGLNVYPAEVEAVLHRHPAVRESAVFGMPDDLWGEAVTAAVVLRPGGHADQDELVRFCAEHLADYKKPRQVVFVDELPKGLTGKVLKPSLQTLVRSDTRYGRTARVQD